MKQRRIGYGAVVQVVLACVILAAFPSVAAEAQGEESSQSCVADPTTLCLNGDRFRVAVRYETEDGRAGDGEAVELTGDTGYFWFFSDNNVEVVIKILNGCTIGEGAYWVFIGGLTDVGVELEVADVRAGQTKTYVNKMGDLFVPVTDTAAFSTCD